MILFKEYINQISPLSDETWQTILPFFQVRELKQGEFKMLDLLHHLTSGLKSLYSTWAYDGIE